MLNLKKPTKMSACPNCQNQLSCGCQRRTASDGTTVCSSCLSAYENNLLAKTQTTVQKQKEEPTLNEWGKNRYKNLHKFVK